MSNIMMKKLVRYLEHVSFPGLAMIAVMVALVMGINVARAGVTATVSFPSTGGLPLNPSFVGLSYEKAALTNNFFTSSNVALVKLFSMIGPGVLRIGGGTVDTTGWNAISNTAPITASSVDALAGFMRALPNWKVIYGVTLFSNTPENCASEAVYAAKALGPSLLGFEIGNEPEFGYHKFSTFLGRWRSMAKAVTHHVPGWAINNDGNGWVLTGVDAGQGVYTTYTVPFARDESGKVSMLTQHYYRAAGKSTNDTMPLLLEPDPHLKRILNTIVPAAAAAHCALGIRVDETGSYSAGGIVGVSDAYGAALWTLDFMFTVALNGGQGVNFHGGGKSPYSPLVDRKTKFEKKTKVVAVRPGFYGLKMFSLIPPGDVVPADVTLSSDINFTAYGVRSASGGISALLNNKDTNNTVAVSVNLGTNVGSAALIELRGPSLYATNGYTLGGAIISTNGTWEGGVQSVLSVTNGQLTVNVPPISAFLLKPIPGHF